MTSRWHRVGGELIRFLIGGVSTTVVSYAAYLLLLPVASYLVAYAAAYAVGIAWSYFANTVFVFRAKPSLGRALAFPLVYLVQFLVGSALLVLLIEQLHLPPKLGPLVIVVLTLPLTYFMSRWMITASFNRLQSLASNVVVQPLRALYSDLNALATRASTRVPGAFDLLFAGAVAIAIAMCFCATWPLNLQVPFYSKTDGLSSQYLIKAVLEHGSYLRNPDVGAPFGATLYDYPIPEPTHVLLIRLIGLFTADPFVAFNLFYLFSFFAAGFTACWAMKKCGIGRLESIAGAIVFALLPYHFLRIVHVFLASYAAIPVIGLYALRLAMFRGTHITDAPRIGWGAIAALALAAGTGVYYAYFGVLLLVVASAIGFARSRSSVPLRVGCAYAGVIVAVVALSLIPNALYQISEGVNLAIAHRKPVEAEMYGLRITQLLFPTMGHRVTELAQFTANYVKPLPPSENFTAALGIVGSIGFLIALGAFFSGDTRRYPKLWACGALCTAAVLYATIGGFGAIASQWMPAIRGLNRISVFIGFFSIVAFMIATSGLLRTWRTPLTRLLLATVVVGLACFDQIPAAGTNRTDVAQFTARSKFFERVAHAVAQGDAVYELPYAYFPESKHPAGSYFQIEPYLYTNGLRWSFGDMQGRPSDLWNEKASTLRGEAFADALAGAGFGAIYVDRQGYTDKGVAIEKELREQFGAPIVEDTALLRAVYRVHAASRASSPLVVTDLGSGWLPWKHDAAGDIARSRGDADMIVANPNGAVVPFTTSFKLTSAVPRKVTLAYGTQVLSALQLNANEQRDVTVSFDAQPGVSRWSLTTDQPAQRVPGTAQEPSAFSISALSYASGSVLSHQ